MERKKIFTQSATKCYYSKRKLSKLYRWIGFGTHILYTFVYV